jgi:Mrp family chromosome partitioning ATPase
MADESCNEQKDCKDCGQSTICSGEKKDDHEQGRLRHRMASIKHKCMVMSGKGGVGKSSVATNLAVTLAMEGYHVGLMDADIHGPNIPKMMGIEDERPSSATDGMAPISTPYGLKVMSIGFFLQSKDDAVIWRGPLKHNLIRQFLGDVEWGELDFLIVDLPPGTGDEALSVAHLIQGVAGAIIVTTPQDVALLDSRKAVTFARQLGIPQIGIVENMSGFSCPHCGKTIDLFKKGGGEKAAREMLVPFLGSIPLDPEMVTCGDSGKPLVAAADHNAVKEAFKRIADNWIQLLEGQPRMLYK